MHGKDAECASENDAAQFFMRRIPSAHPSGSSDGEPLVALIDPALHRRLVCHVDPRGAEYPAQSLPLAPPAD